MKCYKYHLKVCDDILSWAHGETYIQNRLYIPEIGMLGYGAKKAGEIDFFSDSDEAKEGGRARILAKSKILGPLSNNCLEDTAVDDLDSLEDSTFEEGDVTQNIQEIDIPVDTVYDFLKTYREKKNIEDNFNIKARFLISQIK